MSMPSTPLEIVRGDSETFDVAFVNANGSPGDVSGATEIWMTAKRRTADADGDAVFQKTLTGGAISVVTPATGSVAIDAADLAELAGAITLVWDLQVLDVAGKIHTMARGTLKVFADVTRATA